MISPPGNLLVFEHDKEFIVDSLRAGELDGVEVVSEVAERDFFAFLRCQGLLRELAGSYPTPRVKEEVPLWFYLAADLALRLHGRHSFASFPLVVRSGGLLSLLGPGQAERRVDPASGDLHLSCSGFNAKNVYARATPCDPEFLRKLARDTEADKLMRWYGQALPQALKKRRAFDPEGIFIGDGSYLFVPDNPAYEGSEVLSFDRSNHPVDPKKLTPEQRQQVTRRRAYKMVMLLHTNRQREFFLCVGLRVVPARQHDAPVLYGLVQEFVQAVGTGLMKLLILDRGFLDGEAIGRCRKQRIHVLLPLKKNMDLYTDALGLGRDPEADWREVSPPPDPAPPPARRFVLGLRRLTSWSQCPVPLNVVVNREVEASGSEQVWMLATTREWDHPASITELYRLRTSIEERHRLLKCFQGLTAFHSQAWNLVVHQVVFTLLTSTLLQWQLHRRERAALNRRTPARVRDAMLPAAEQIAVYNRQRFAFLDVYEYQELLLTLTEAARLKILRRTRQLRRSMYEIPQPRRGPPR